MSTLTIKKLYILLAVYLVAVTASGMVSAQQGPAPEPPEMSGVDYWHYKSFGRGLRIDSTDEAYIRGEYFDVHGWMPFRLRRDSIQAPEAKVEGYRRSVAGFLVLLKHGGTEKLSSYGRKGLERLTGKQFETTDEWEAWLSENKPYLTLSPDGERLIVDEKAKRASKPLRELQKNR